MPIELLGSNLNTFGNAGQFETDRSTWGFADDATYWAATRSAAQKSAGVYSCKLDVTGSYDAILLQQKLVKANCNIGKDKYYIAKAKVYVPASDVPYDGADIIQLESVFGVSETSAVTKTITECIDSWQEVEFRFKFVQESFYGINYKIDLVVKGITGATPPAGDIYVDEFTVFEYQEAETPTCTLAIDAGTTVVTHETALDADNGAITVAITGGTAPIEYSKNNIAWQSSNQFTGLAPGSHTIYVRDSSAPQCTAQQVFNVDEYGIAFDYTVTITSESVAGAEDGQIEISVTGPGAPFTYSKDNGATYQGSNIFSGLAPGNYVVVVKDSGNATKSQGVTIAGGSSDFEKVYFSKNPIQYDRYSTPENYLEDNYKVHVDVAYEGTAGSGTFTKSMSASKAPLSVLTPNQLVSFNLQPAFRGRLTPTPPTLNAGAIVRLTDRIKLFKVNYGDIFDQMEAPASTISSNPFIVMLGGLSKYQYAKINYFYSYLPTNKKFMTWAPLVKDVDYNQEDYLQFWVYNQSMSLVKLIVKAYFDDDTSSFAAPASIPAITVQYGHLLQIPAGPLNSGAIGIFPEKNLKYYELWLQDQDDNIISEVRTYKITAFKNPRTRYYLFCNSLGGYEVLRTYGFSEENAEITRDIIERFSGYGSFTTLGQFMAGEASKRNIQRVSSGYFAGALSKQWLEYMQEVAMSRYVYDITSGVRLPVVNNTKNVTARQNEDNKRFVRFEFLHAYEDQNYSPESI